MRVRPFLEYFFLTKQAEIKLTDPVIQGEFGFASAIDGDRVIIGDTGSTYYPGRAIIYEKATSLSWSTATSQTLASAGNSDFGCSVGISGDYAIIGKTRKGI